MARIIIEFDDNQKRSLLGETDPGDRFPWKTIEEVINRSAERRETAKAKRRDIWIAETVAEIRGLQLRILNTLQRIERKVGMTLLNTTQLEAAVSKIDSTIDEAVVILKDDTKSAQERINAATATLERENTDLGDAIASVNPTVPGGAIGPGGAIDTDAPADAPVGGGDNVSTQPAGDASAVGDATPGTGGEAAPNQ